MNSEDADDFSNFEEQLNDITKKICIFEDDEISEVWKKSQSRGGTTTTTIASSSPEAGRMKPPSLDVQLHHLFPHPSRSPQSPRKDGRISPEGSSSSTQSLNKGERSSLDSSSVGGLVPQCKPLNLKSAQKGGGGIYPRTTPIDCGGSGGSPGGGVKTNLVQNLERLKDLSFRNRPSVLQLTNLWNGQDSPPSGKMSTTGHRGYSSDGKRDQTPGRGNIYTNPNNPTSPTKIGELTPLKDAKYSMVNGYVYGHQQQGDDASSSSTSSSSFPGRRLPELNRSKLHSPAASSPPSPPPSSCSIPGKTFFSGDLIAVSGGGHTSSGFSPFRERGSVGDRSFHVTGSGAGHLAQQRNNVETVPSSIIQGGGSGKPLQMMSKWGFSSTARPGRDQLQKTNSLDSNDGGQGQIQGHGRVIIDRHPFSLSSTLKRTTSLSKFDDDDEFLLSPPTTISSSRMMTTTTTNRYGYGKDTSTSSNPAQKSSSGFEPASSSPPAPSSSSSSASAGFNNRSAYCFAHGGSPSSSPAAAAAASSSSSSSPAVDFGSSSKSPGGVGGRVGGAAASLSSPYATLRLQNGRNKTTPIARKGDRCMSPHPLSSIPISPSTRLAEDIQATEIRRLRQDLQWAKEQVALLTSRLSTNVNVVQAFDQSLSNIAGRLHQLSTTSQQHKNSELSELLATVESLRRQNLGQPSLESVRKATSPVPPATIVPGVSVDPGGVGPRSASVSDDHSPGVRPVMCRQASSDSVTSITSSTISAFSSTSQVTNSSAVTADQQQTSKKKTVKNWLRSSFGKAFSRKKSNPSQKTRPASTPATAPPVLHANSMPSIPYSGSNSQLSYAGSTESELCQYQQSSIMSSSTTSSNQQTHGHFYQRSPMASDSAYLPYQSSFPLSLSTMKGDDGGDNNIRRQQQLAYNCPSSSSSSANHKRSESLDQNVKLQRPSCLDVLLNERPRRDGHKITVCVELQQSNCNNAKLETKKEIIIGTLTVGDRTSWDLLDGLVRRVFQEHLIRLDPATSLGLTGESVSNYRVGEIVRSKDSKTPELLPIGYLVGDINNVTISLRGNREESVDQLSFETLIPKSILHRYLKLLLEHRRIILSGSTGTGKTYLAQKLAECLVTRSGSDKGTDAVALFRVDNQSSKELRQYLTNMADQCERGSDRLPVVVILDNLHHVSSLSDVFSAFLDTNYQNSPYIIGTMNQATCSTTDLQLHHNFRWVLYANHIEPIRSFLGRYLRRQLVANEITSCGGANTELNKVVEWLPKVWQHVNKFLETHSSCDITIGPRLFLLCPMDVNQSQVWFTDLWNYSIVPYLLEAVREGIQTYGCRAPWEDLADWVIDNYPWNKQTTKPALLRLRPEDVGYETKASPGDKIIRTDGSSHEAFDNRDMETSLVDILTRLQETAKHSDSEDTTTDSNDFNHMESCNADDKNGGCLIIADDLSTSSPLRTSIL